MIEETFFFQLRIIISQFGDDEVSLRVVTFVLLAQLTRHFGLPIPLRNYCHFFCFSLECLS
jgi:hypothetical protein